MAADRVVKWKMEFLPALYIHVCDNSWDFALMVYALIWSSNTNAHNIYSFKKPKVWSEPSYAFKLCVWEQWRLWHDCVNAKCLLIRIFHECEGRIKKSDPRIAVWHHEACRVMTNGDPMGRIIKIYHECEGRIEKSVPRITVWHHEACRVMTNGDSEGQLFLSYPHTINGFFFLLTTVFFLFENKLPESLNTLICNFAWWRHLNMTSLDDNVREFQYNQCIKPSRDSIGKIAWVR